MDREAIYSAISFRLRIDVDCYLTTDIAIANETLSTIPARYSMIHFTCDACQRVIDSKLEPRFVLRLEVYEALGESVEADYEQADHLRELEEIIDRGDSDEMQLDEELYKQLRFDLCTECREQFMLNPLGSMKRVRLGFSNN